MSVLELATLKPGLHEDLAHRLAVSARHRPATMHGQAWLAAGRQRGWLRVLVHADVRPGYRQVVEIGPSVRCTPPNFAESPRRQPAFVDLVLSDDVVVHYDVPQSEEGGRFHHAVTRHLIVEVGDPAALGTPPDYFWVTPAELNHRIRSGCQVNSEARSLFACLQAVW